MRDTLRASPFRWCRVGTPEPGNEQRRHEASEAEEVKSHRRRMKLLFEPRLGTRCHEAAQVAQRTGYFTCQGIFDWYDRRVIIHWHGHIHLLDNFQHPLHVFGIITDNQGLAAINRQKRELLLASRIRNDTLL